MKKEALGVRHHHIRTIISGLSPLEEGSSAHSSPSYQACHPLKKKALGVRRHHIRPVNLSARKLSKKALRIYHHHISLITPSRRE